MNYNIVWIIFLFGFAHHAFAQDLILPLWPEGIPCANEHQLEIEDQGKDRGRFLRKVHAPDIAVYKPQNPNGTAVLICPGGGYTVLAYDWEGTTFARWFNELGITAIVLKYRLPHWENEKCRDQVALPDAQRAMRLIRKHASEWNLQDGKMGVMGFSAGGHLASTLSTHYDNGNPSDIGINQYSSKPDFSILVYPVITFDPDVTHSGSKNNLIGKEADQEQIHRFSNDLHITSDTPPALLIHASDDKGVPVENSIRYYQGLIANGVSAALHVYESGGHGFAMAKNKAGAVTTWLDTLQNWMKERELY